MDDVLQLAENEVRKVAEGKNSLIYYQEESEFNHPVLIKVIREERNFYPYSTQILNEDFILKNLEIEGVRKSLGQVTLNGRPAVRLEYVDGMTLKGFILKETVPFIEKLKIAISICEILDQVHHDDIIHKDINSHNILITPSYEVHLIDFGLATRLNTKSEIRTVSNYVAGTLGYISPEQTGRVNHVVDLRSDLYSLGVVLYELFSGQLPFSSQDSMELIHAHLAIEPTPLVELNPGIPQVISEIVKKLLSKNMERRYQTSTGVLADLQDCYSQLSLQINIEEFKIGKRDRPDKFLIPSKLYGRVDESKALLNSISRSGNGKEATFITGNSGAGKTTLIYEVHKPLTKKNGYFIQGKFEQFQKDIPYYALVDAITHLVNLLLSEPEEKLDYWKTTLQDTLGREGKLIADLIPNLELIIGKQRTPDKLGINEAQSSFDYTFLKFVKALATKEHPIILFIDDMQWADASSLHLLKKIICDDEINNFYFIGAYRQNEVDQTHPTAMMVQELKSAIQVNNIYLGELTLKDISELVSDTLLLEKEQCAALAKIVLAKTAGNPFFINQFLQSIYENKLISFQWDGSEGNWLIDWDGMKKMTFTDNVVEFMISKIERIDERQKEVLILGACVGDSFDLETLSYISNRKWKDVEESLYHLVKHQYIFAMSDNPDYIHLQYNFNRNGKGKNIRYKFSHDRIRQASYLMVPEDMKPMLHLKVGRKMLENITPAKLPEHIFDVVFHLNNGAPQIPDDMLRGQLIDLNYKAACKAKASAAYQNALFHYERSIAYIQLDSSVEGHPAHINVFTETMECAYLTGNYHRMEELGKQVFAMTDDIYERLGAYRVTIYSLIARNKYKDATRLGLDVLKNFNVRFPEQPAKPQIIASFINTALRLGNKKASYFRQLPPITDKKALAILEIILSFASAAYHVTPELFPVIILKMIRLSLKYGASGDLVATYGSLGIIFCGIVDKIDDGYAFGTESIKMLDEFPNTRHVRSRTKLIFATFINHWKDHLKKSLPILLESYRDGLETGDQEFAAGSIFVHSYHSFLLGEPLRAILDRQADFHRKIGQLNQKSYEYYNSIDYQTIINLSQKTDNPAKLSGEVFDESCFLENEDGQDMRNDKTALFHYHFCKMCLHYFSDEFEKALAHSDQLKKLDVAISSPFIPQHLFYDALIGLEICQNTVFKSTRRTWLKRIKANHAKLKKWMGHAPMNFRHKVSIIEAGIHFVFKKDHQKTRNLFEEGILEASVNGYTNDLAVACEMAGNYYWSLGDTTQKTEYLKKAYAAYQKWGIAIKLKKLSNYSGEQVKSFEQNDITSSTFMELKSNISQLDVSTIIKASSAITGEIKLKKLVHQLLKIVTQNAGAQCGAFVLNTDNQMQVQATIDEKGKITEPQDGSHYSPDCYSDRIVQYVDRTGESLVIEDALADDRFLDDEYIQAKKCRSVLCFPIVSKKKRNGFIFLENNLTTGVFDEKRVEILKLLSGQMAVSLENALLYDSLEQKVEERTYELEQQRNELRNKNNELTNLNQEKDDLINVVSHDLRSPLNQIKGLAQLTLMEITNERVVDYTGKMIEAADRLNNMISRILDISAIEAQKIELKPERVDVVSLVRQVVDSFSQTAKKKQIELVANSNVTEGNIRIDKNYFIQILENLMSNAIKFSNLNGNVEVSINYGKELVTIEVKDQGPGISEADQKILFNKFQRLSAKPTAGEKSTGLGLAIVKRYVDAMEGKLWCESEQGKGASFILEFPVK